MLAEIINIGDELLIGQVINSNAAWIAERLNAIGIRVRQITSVSDTRMHITDSIESATLNSDLVILTGGLGPTKDDITKHTLAEYFQTELILHEPSLRHVEEFFKSRGRVITELNRKQAELPANCDPLPNPNGTAPGMWFEKDGKILVSLPGVPYEMKALMDDHVLPRLASKINGEVIIHKTVLTHGAGESLLAEMIAGWEDDLPPQIRLAYLPQPGMVRLRLTATGEDRSNLEDEIHAQVETLQNLIPGLIFGFDTETMESVTGKLLRESAYTLSTAESCTGGYLASMITRVPGSSDYYRGSVIAYSNELKTKLLDVEPAMLEKYGAVSEQVVIRMAESAKKITGSSFALATSGIAGPSGGTPEKPVGLVWIALAGPDGVKSKSFLFGNNRERNIHMASLAALNMLRLKLISIKS